MFDRRIDTGRLKVKYVLGNHAAMPNYPDGEDIIFEIIRELCSKPNKKTKFTDVSISKKFGISIDEVNNKLLKFVHDNIIEMVGNTRTKITYDFKSNPYS